MFFFEVWKQLRCREKRRKKTGMDIEQKERERRKVSVSGKLKTQLLKKNEQRLLQSKEKER
jgi:hypothetical protein